jgi:hypothetical protein
MCQLRHAWARATVGNQSSTGHNTLHWMYLKRSFQAGSVRHLRTRTEADKLIYPEPASTQHHNLQSFLEYAERTSLDPKATTYKGTHFEYTVANTLSQYGFSLQRTGKRLDKGIDLLGTWSVPSAKEPLRVFVQCKVGVIGPNLIRELEGTFRGTPVGWRGQDVLGLLVSPKVATSHLRDSLGRSQRPMAFVSCSQDGHLQQFIWNRRSQEAGLEGLGVSVRRDEHENHAAQLVLTWQSKSLPITTSE